ncbi:MAG TPA: metal-sulfur cluster assembly factor [Dehalococcoidia bacterium]|jgi:metal-sulfur cluster biosynthetic enzyme|nr:metal-sulfur cluster assembly factor [SAR202 cluster bacterium]HIN34771.1 metal-sulfur cluster assembly factor [Dehalococcoidia bacterium]|tara:strand:+ start:2651 stop:2962 length:312 start_codon:yes stop_codon:yes gene_type:complete
MAEETVTLESIYEALKTVYDPEIPVNVVDLGLVYDVQLKDTGDVYIQMTLTFPGCGMGPYIGQQAEWAVQELDGVEEVQIEMVFDPPWSPELISEEARSQLGI